MKVTIRLEHEGHGYEKAIEDCDPRETYVAIQTLAMQMLGHWRGMLYSEEEALDPFKVDAPVSADPFNSER